MLAIKQRCIILYINYNIQSKDLSIYSLISFCVLIIYLQMSFL